MFIKWINLVLMASLISNAWCSENISEDLDYEDFNESDSKTQTENHSKKEIKATEEQTIKTILPKYLNEIFKKKTENENILNLIDILSMLNLQSNLKNAVNEYYAYEFKRSSPRAKRQSESDGAEASQNVETTQREKEQLSEDMEQSKVIEKTEDTTRSEGIQESEKPNEPVMEENSSLPDGQQHSSHENTANIADSNKESPPESDRSTPLADNDNSNNQSSQTNGDNSNDHTENIVSSNTESNQSSNRISEMPNSENVHYFSSQANRDETNDTTNNDANSNTENNPESNSSISLPDSNNSNDQSILSNHGPTTENVKTNVKTSEESVLSADVNNFQDGDVTDNNVSFNDDSTSTPLNSENQTFITEQNQNDKLNHKNTNSASNIEPRPHIKNNALQRPESTFNSEGTSNNRQSEVQGTLSLNQLTNLQAVLSDNFGVNSRDSKPVAHFSINNSRTDEKPIVVIVYNCSCDKDSQNQGQKSLTIADSSKDNDNSLDSNTNKDVSLDSLNTRRMIPDYQLTDNVSRQKNDDWISTIPVVHNNNIENKTLSNAALENDLFSKCRSLLGLQLDSQVNSESESEKDTGSQTAEQNIDNKSSENTKMIQNLDDTPLPNNNNLQNLVSKSSNVFSNLPNVRNIVGTALENGLLSRLREKRNVKRSSAENKHTITRQKRDLLNHINEALKTFFTLPSSGINTVLGPFSDQNDDNRTKRDIPIEVYSESDNQWGELQDSCNEENDSEEIVLGIRPITINVYIQQASKKMEKENKRNKKKASKFTEKSPRSNYVIEI